MSVVGQSVQRVDAVGKVTGQTQYPGDINFPNQAYMKILFANRPHAVVRRIDTRRAEAIEGVIAVFTAKDVPVNEYGLIMPGPASSVRAGFEETFCRPGALYWRPGSSGRGGNRRNRGQSARFD